ncbi:hypothetical protein KI688_000490 [Linnemannia hyalina]|uniref:Uncharacterized protein n=1 Tax=Linnemannia hyalina TaxID=64524 RepID=A0A9P8BRF6_9FUNG|nr:hypothetical protein KI688_007478 [Linnemannia hyalina]KAG9062131.1 hypothetical protein KI688_006463 [Linnemannia hyalina]KAG9064961.1 hypothetical protein KI688_002279 [Linnemannia hyalina]KAG9065984.1 hypothetical protein KI688_001198 [Linnemannia hyalina]KAG9069726.1 hypothetical protein KI688_009050 [Linnemannia hyalina]
MTSTRSTHGTKRPVKNTRFAHELESSQQQLSASNNWSKEDSIEQEDSIEHEDCIDHEADETVCLSQDPLSQVAEDRSPPPVSSPIPVSSPVPVLLSAPAPSSENIPQAWWTSLQQEQLVAYTQQQQELFAQAGRVYERLLSCTSQQEYDQLTLVRQHLDQKEKELRYMLEARQAWESFARTYEQRLTYLNSRTQSNP